jgi:hypothetical protein
MKKSAKPQAGDRKQKTPAASHQDEVRKITEENREYLATLDEEQPLPQITFAPSLRKAAPFQNDPKHISSAKSDERKSDFQQSNSKSKTAPVGGNDATPSNECEQLISITHYEPRWNIFWKRYGELLKSLFWIGSFIGAIVATIAFIYFGIHASDFADKHPLLHPQTSAGNPNGSVGSDDLKFDAYYTAKQFIQGQYPGAKSFSDFENSHVDDRGNGVWWVTVNVDGVNAFNAPIRNTMLAEMKSQNGHWYLIEIDNLNGGGQNSAPLDNPE